MCVGPSAESEVPSCLQTQEVLWGPREGGTSAWGGRQGPEGFWEDMWGLPHFDSKGRDWIW